MGTGTVGKHGKKTQKGSEKDVKHIWTDGMTVMTQSLIFVSIKNR